MLYEKVTKLNCLRNIVWGITKPLPVCYSTERWSHFFDVIKYQYPAQLSGLNDLFVAYLIQEP